MKKILSLLLVFVLCFSVVAYTVPESVSAESNKITVGEEKEIESDNCFVFEPEESGWYMYYSSGDNDIKGQIQDAVSSELLAESDNYGYNFWGRTVILGDFKLIHYFEAGKTYHLVSIDESYYSSGYSKGTYCVGVEKLTKANSMTIQNQEEVNVGIGLRREFEIIYSPEDCIPETVTWSSDNTDIVSVDENGLCHFKKYGTAILTAVTENGLSDSITVHVTDSSQIRLNEEKQDMAGIHNSGKYVFIPEVTAEYGFSVKSFTGHMQSAPFLLKIYDKDYNLIAETEEWSTDSTLYSRMEKGECYCLEWKSYGGDVCGDLTATVLLLGEPVYDSEIVTTDELQQVGEEVPFESITEIKADVEESVDITFFDAKSIHKFTPEESGEYKIFATGKDNVMFVVLDETAKIIVEAGENPVVVDMVADKTYIIQSYISRSSYSGLGQYTLEINKLPKAESIEITNGEKIVEHIGYSETLNLSFAPEEHENEPLVWTSSDESVATVKDGLLVLKNVGTATITVSDERGISDSIEVECIHHPEITVGVDDTLTVTEKTTTFTFIPSVSGVYKFYGTSYVYEDAKLKCIVNKATEAPELVIRGNDFLEIEYQFNAGEIYYITIETLSSDAVGVLKYSLELKNKLYNMGDVSGDGNISADDALILLKSAAKLSELTEEETSLGDMNGDNTISAEDALEVLKTAAKLN